MTSPDPSADEPPEHNAEQVRHGWVNRRREKIVEEIARNRRGDYAVPTWVLVAALVLLVGGWIAVVVFS
ncbi:hypothetical protein OG792_14635 [Micromonospora sp. NBC_01699]|uniref:hypothetical protein n=1 Tax=Micromonospora sp. NBC_01699 TaxID=2975984 RepID=UPI002E37692C|nr:hypothetical protein [Micromonospora sp. NBC_01699]